MTSSTHLLVSFWRRIINELFFNVKNVKNLELSSPTSFTSVADAKIGAVKLDLLEKRRLAFASGLNGLLQTDFNASLLTVAHVQHRLPLQALWPDIDALLWIGRRQSTDSNHLQANISGLVWRMKKLSNYLPG